MSLTGSRAAARGSLYGGRQSQRRVPLPGFGGGVGLGEGSLCCEVQCIMGNGNMGPPVNRMTDMTENITFPQLCWRAVKTL